MRALLASGVLLLTTTSLFAQGGYRPYGYANRSGFGSVVFPGTGGPPPLRSPFSISDPGFARRLGGIVGGFRPYRGGQGGYGGVVAVPVPVPVGGYYGYDPSQEYEQPPVQYQQPVQQAPNITIVLPPQAVQSYYQQPEAPARPSVREYGPDDYGKPDPDSNMRIYQVPPRGQPAQPQTGDESVMFLIALKDHSIYTAAAYWVEGETLHYITTQGEHNQVSLDLVDRETSARLNKGRKAEFRLPPPR